MAKNSARRDDNQSKDKKIVYINCINMQGQEPEKDINKSIVITALEAKTMRDLQKSLEEGALFASAESFVGIKEDDGRLATRYSSVLQSKMSPEARAQSQEAVARFCDEKGYNSIEEYIENKDKESKTKVVSEEKVLSKKDLKERLAIVQEELKRQKAINDGATDFTAVKKAKEATKANSGERGA